MGFFPFFKDKNTGFSMTTNKVLLLIKNIVENEF